MLGLWRCDLDTRPYGPKLTTRSAEPAPVANVERTITDTVAPDSSRQEWLGPGDLRRACAAPTSCGISTSALAPTSRPTAASAVVARNSGCPPPAPRIDGAEHCRRHSDAAFTDVGSSRVCSRPANAGASSIPTVRRSAAPDASGTADGRAGSRTSIRAFRAPCAYAIFVAPAECDSSGARQRHTVSSCNTCIGIRTCEL